MQEGGGDGIFVATDITQESDVAALVSAACSTYGRLDMAFNNAGVGELMDCLTHEKSMHDYDHVMNTNVIGTLLSLKYEIPAMSERGRGAIVNTSSVSGLVGFPGAAIYVASKHAVLGLTKASGVGDGHHRHPDGA
jgi:NAD(P)-dependent dehydrogenase (short-subunit alcohol dehydrogenase family)